MKQASFAAQLGSAFAADTQKVNQGYPILQVMAYDEESGWSEWFEDEAMGDNINQEIFDSLIPAELQNRDLTRDITRAEFCAVSVRLYEQMGGQKLDAAAPDSPFADTGSDAVKKAYALGITNGVSPTAFAPYTHISREQLATMLTRVYKALNLPGWTLATDDQYTLDYSGTTPFADDGDISAYAKPSVYFMVKNQVIKGTSPPPSPPERHRRPGGHWLRQRLPGAGSHHGGADVPEAVRTVKACERTENSAGPPSAGPRCFSACFLRGQLIFRVSQRVFT